MSSHVSPHLSYVVTGLPIEPFKPLFGLSDPELASRGVLRRQVDAPQSYPCRVTLEDVEPGGSVLLLNYEHQPAPTPFRASHAIFVSEQARETRRHVDELPASITSRPHISLRAFDAAGMIVTAEVRGGAELEEAVERLLQRAEVAYLHAHYAGMGCYAARIDRR